MPVYPQKGGEAFAVAKFWTSSYGLLEVLRDIYCNILHYYAGTAVAVKRKRKAS